MFKLDESQFSLLGGFIGLVIWIAIKCLGLYLGFIGYVCMFSPTTVPYGLGVLVIAACLVWHGSLINLWYGYNAKGAEVCKPRQSKPVPEKTPEQLEADKVFKKWMVELAVFMPLLILVWGGVMYFVESW